MGMKEMGAGFGLVAKVGVGAVGSAMATDTIMGAIPTEKLSPVNRDLATVGVGLLVSAGLLAVGIPREYAAGPAVGNAAGAAVSAGRRMGWSSKLRDQYQASTGSAGLRR